MKDLNLLDAVGGIDDRYITEASEEKNTHRNIWVKWVAVAACLCLVAAGTFGIWNIYNRPEGPVPAVSTDDTANGSKVTGAATEQTEPAEGISIPAKTIDSQNAGSTADMIGLVVYNGNIYTHAGHYEGEQAAEVMKLKGDFLGQVGGTINEWSGKDELSSELASTYSGKVYTVKGYDPGFRLCLVTDGYYGIILLDRLNGITISEGKDLFEDRLRLSENVGSVSYQTHNDWNNGLKNIQGSVVTDDMWEAFIRDVDSGRFVYTFMPDGSFYEDHPYSNIYDTPNQTHLYLSMKDGTVVELRLIEGGYVGYEATDFNWYFVKIPGEAFDAVYDACGGTHITEW